MDKIEALNSTLNEIKKQVYDKINFQISDLHNEDEGINYDACQFELNGLNIISRSSKITPKKIGQFVTFWKRNEKGITEAFNETDKIDFYIVNVKTEENLGQFVFPISVLINKKIISTETQEGKRGFRVYPPYSKTSNKQAEKTQKWQINYYFEINKSIDVDEIINLYKAKQNIIK